MPCKATLPLAKATLLAACLWSLRTLGTFAALAGANPANGPSQTGPESAATDHDCQADGAARRERGGLGGDRRPGRRLPRPLLEQDFGRAWAAGRRGDRVHRPPGQRERYAPARLRRRRRA